MDIKKIIIPKQSGCYQFYNQAGKLLYIGKAADLRSRVLSYWRQSANHNPAKQAMMNEIAQIKWITVESEIESLLLEANLIKKYQPPFNVDLRDDKRFQYIVVTTGDEIPGVFTARTIGQSGRYFGPYTGGMAVKETLKAIRKIWPYCTTRRVGPKPCFYYQINRCLGPCGGAVSVKEYKERVIKPIILFLEGKKGMIIRELEARSKKLEREVRSKKPASPAGRLEVRSTEDAERELAGIKYELLNMRNVLEHARILSIGEKYAADVVELAKVLGLKRVPERIEGYDIANIFGREAVGSMVVFKNGEPDKNEYRKFKIRIGEPAFAKASADKGRRMDLEKLGDVQMLREVLERRFKHASNLTPFNPHPGLRPPLSKLGEGTGVRDGRYDWPSPDLIIVDGGKAQLNTVSRVLKANKSDIPFLAVSKGGGLRSAMARDKIFFPGQSEPLVLPLASPALHIIKRVRDEAHRFAIGYHKLLRKKKMLT
jgi:excinuclease ABC subunit C